LPFALFNVSAQTELSLEDAVSYALEHNLSLKKIEIDLAASSYLQRNLWLEIFFPTINANAGVEYRNPLFSDAPRSNTNPNYSIGLGLNLGLNAGIPYTMKNIRLAHQSDLLRYEDASNQLAIQVTRLYYSLVAEKNNLLLLNEVFDLAQRQFTRSETLFRNGLVGELSLTQSRLALENARYSLSAAKIAHENNVSAFLAILGMSIDENPILTGEVALIKIEADADMLIRDYLPTRPDIVRYNQEIQRLTTAHMMTILQNRAPSVNLSVDWGSSAFDPFADLLRASARLIIPIDPWVPGTSRARPITERANAVEKSVLDLEMTKDAAETQIRSLTALLRNSWDSILIARLSLEAAQRNYQLTEHGFNNGTVEALTLQDARNNMANARQRLLQTELSYFNMILDLSSAINTDWKNLVQIFGVQNE